MLRPQPRQEHMQAEIVCPLPNEAGPYHSNATAYCRTVVKRRLINMMRVPK